MFIIACDSGKLGHDVVLPPNVNLLYYRSNAQVGKHPLHVIKRLLNLGVTRKPCSKAKMPLFHTGALFHTNEPLGDLPQKLRRLQLDAHAIGVEFAYHVARALGRPEFGVRNQTAAKLSK